MHRVKRFWKLRWLVWAALIPLMWLALRQVPISAVWSTLAGLEFWQLACLILVNVGIFMLFTGRWWLILRGLGYRLPFFSLMGYRMAGFGITYFTPGPQIGGEPLQVVLVRNRHCVPTSVSVAAVTLDKLLEMQSNFAFLVVGVTVILRDGLFGEQLNLAVLFAVGGLVLLPAGYLLLLWLGARPITALSGIAASLLPQARTIKTLHLGATLAENQVSLFLKQKTLTMLAALLISLLIWASMGVEYWLSMRFLGMHPDVLQTITLITAARVAFLLPIPAGMGTLEASQVLAAEALGIPLALGIGVSLLIRARDLSFAGLGLYLGAAFTRSRGIQGLPSETGD